MSLREERLRHGETMIIRHQKLDKESLILNTPCRLRGQLDEGTDKGGVIASMMKDLVYLEEKLIRREAMKTSLGLRSAVVGRGGAVTRKGGDATAELSAL